MDPGLWDKTLSALIATSPGIVAALVAVWLTDKFARKREDRNEERTRRATKEKQSFDQWEAVRRETAQRRLDALEKGAASLPVAVNELRMMKARAEIAEFPNVAVGSLSAGCAPLQIHFGKLFIEEIEALESAYGDCVKSASAIALAATWLVMRREGRTQDDGVDGERRNHSEAAEQWTKSIDRFEKLLSPFLSNLMTAADFLNDPKNVNGKIFTS